MARLCAALVAAAAAFCLPSVSLAQSPRIDHVAMRRLFFELRVDSGRFTNAARTFLLRKDRWPPQGDDKVLWDGIKAFDDSVDAVADEYARTAYPKTMEEQTRAAMERGVELNALLAEAQIMTGLMRRWDRLEESLARAADVYRWDYASARFDVLPEEPVVADPIELNEGVAPYQPPPRHFEGDIDPTRRNREVEIPSRFTNSDNLAVGETLSDIEHITRSVLARLSATRVVSTGDLSEIGGDERLEDGFDLPTELELERTEADVLAFESAANEALHRFALTRSAADIRTEVATLLRLGRHVEVGFRRDRPGEDTTDAWIAVRGKLNFLAVVYDLETLRYN